MGWWLCDFVSRSVRIVSMQAEVVVEQPHGSFPIQFLMRIFLPVIPKERSRACGLHTCGLHAFLGMRGALCFPADEWTSMP